MGLVGIGGGVNTMTRRIPMRPLVARRARAARVPESSNAAMQYTPAPPVCCATHQVAEEDMSCREKVSVIMPSHSVMKGLRRAS